MLLNHKRILQRLRRRGETSRAVLAQELELTGGAITRLTKELLDRDILHEGERVAGKRGQPAVLLSIKPSRWFSVGLALHTRHADVVITDVDGSVVQQSYYSLGGRELFANNLCEHVLAELAKAKIDIEAIVGIGIAISGYVNTELSEIIPAEHERQQEIERLKQELAVRANTPVFTENIANAAALSEFLLARDDWSDDFIFVHLGRGVGGGVVLNGRLYRGPASNAGEIGGFFPYGTPRPSALDFQNTMRIAGYECESYDALSNYLHLDNATFEGWLTRSAEQITTAICAAVWWLSPKTIVIGGSLPGDVIEELIKRISLERAAQHKSNIQLPLITCSHFNQLAAAIGVSYLPFYSLWGPNDA